MVREQWQQNEICVDVDILMHKSGTEEKKGV